jgi:O-antigen/teichoic acid export membrane protein
MKLQSIEDWLERQLSRLFKNELVRRMVKNSGYLFSNNGFSAAASMLQGILAARLLGAAGFGILGTITLFTSVINNFVSFRMGELVVKFVGHHTEHDDPRSAAAAFKLAAIFEMLASFIAFGLIVLLAPMGARYFAKDPSMAPLFVLYGLVVLANLIAESSTGLLQIFDRFRRLAGLGIAQSCVTLGLIVITYVSHGGLAGILIAYMAGKALGALGITVAALIEASRRWGAGWWRTPISLLKPSFRELASFAISTNISATISLVTKDSELLWVSFLRGPTEAGYYKLALALANLVQMPVDPLPQATYPELSRQVARSQWDNVRYVLRQGSRLAGAYSLGAALILTLFGQFLIRFLYSPEFLPAYPALLILMAGLVIANIFYWRRVALLALGRADYPAKVNLVLAIAKVIGTLALVPVYGYLASAALLSAFYWLGSLATVWKIHLLISERETLSRAPAGRQS